MARADKGLIMKYIRYTLVILFKIFAKVFGLFWFFIVFKFRSYARNRVYNYVLENNIYLKRLAERSPSLFGTKGFNAKYTLKDVHNVRVQGYIRYRKVSWIEYQFCFWIIWGWVDDDSNHDTMSGGYREGMVFGNSFDLGDVRGQYPEFKLKESWDWLVRNTAYNFNYMLEECLPTSKNFFYKRITNRLFDWHFGYLPSGSRAGRMVWFTEDIDKIRN